MSSNTDITGLIKQIHESPLKLVIVSSGGGTNAIASLLKVPGASKTVLESYIPYARESLAHYLLKEPDQYCSLDTTLSMAAKAYSAAKKIDTKTNIDKLFGIGITASLLLLMKKKESTGSSLHFRLEIIQRVLNALSKKEKGLVRKRNSSLQGI